MWDSRPQWPSAGLARVLWSWKPEPEWLSFSRTVLTPQLERTVAWLSQCGSGQLRAWIIVKKWCNAKIKNQQIYLFNNEWTDKTIQKLKTVNLGLLSRIWPVMSWNILCVNNEWCEKGVLTNYLRHDFGGFIWKCKDKGDFKLFLDKINYKLFMGCIHQILMLRSKDPNVFGINHFMDWSKQNYQSTILQCANFLQFHFDYLNWKQLHSMISNPLLQIFFKTIIQMCANTFALRNIYVL